MGKASMDRRDGGHQVRTDLAVVIPAMNEETLIARCIGSVISAGIPPQRIFVVDDASTDRTPAVLAGINGINVLRNEQRTGKAGSVLRLIEHFGIVERFTYVSLLDADSYVDSGKLAAVSLAFDEDPTAVLVCGGPRGMAYNHITAFRTLEYYVAADVSKGTGSARRDHGRARLCVHLQDVDHPLARLARWHAGRGHGPDDSDSSPAAGSRPLRARGDRQDAGPAAHR